jgi:hypothetical protein
MKKFTLLVLLSDGSSTEVMTMEIRCTQIPNFSKTRAITGPDGFTKPNETFLLA